MSQNEMILAALTKGDRLTPQDALRRFGCFRLAARVKDLKRAGHVIATEIIEVDGGARVARYSLGAP
jgi:hypothetical protein